jgi:hypothetical protein
MIPFPKPKRNLEKCQRWIRACGRELFSVEKVTRWMYICSKHFVVGTVSCSAVGFLFFLRQSSVFHSIQHYWPLKYVVQTGIVCTIF